MDDEKPSPRADLLTGAAWLGLAAAIVIASWRMDRLGHLQATLYTMPGLVPGLLGAAIGLMAIILMLRAVRAGALAQTTWPRIRISEHWRLIAVIGLGLIYAVGLVGRGLPFWLASTIYVTVFVIVFQFEDRRRAGTLGRGIAFAILFGAAAGLAIHYGFQDVFLVRVP
jgi:putative tricarboxylic transport membrane protein